MQRYFIYLSYDGTDYHGWQLQPNGISVQETLEKALSLCLRRTTGVTGAGRTDAGVHASLMTAHFDADEPIQPDGLTDKLNRLLPPDISIHRIVPVTAEAHARFSATSRTYQYHVITAKLPFRRRYALRLYGQAPDFGKMNEAARRLYGYTDFTSFSKLHTDVKTNNCRILHAGWTQTGTDEWVFTIRADRFLRNMVRAIVGTLLEVGRGKLSPEGFCRIIEEKDRCKAGTSVPAQALFLTEITYPDTIFLPGPVQ